MIPARKNTILLYLINWTRNDISPWLEQKRFYFGEDISNNRPVVARSKVLSSLTTRQVKNRLLWSEFENNGVSRCLYLCSLTFWLFLSPWSTVFLLSSYLIDVQYVSSTIHPVSIHSSPYCERELSCLQYGKYSSNCSMKQAFNPTGCETSSGDNFAYWLK